MKKTAIIGALPTLNEFEKLSDVTLKTNASFQELQLSLMYADTVYKLNKKRGSNFTPKKKKRKK